MTPLEMVGLQQLYWELDDACTGGDMMASPADCHGRGIVIDVTEHGEAYDLTPHRVFLIWRHRLTRRRGCTEMFAPDELTFRRAVHWPRAMVRAEGSVECQVMISFADGGALTSRTFLVRVQEDLGAYADAGDGFTIFIEAIKRYEDASGELLTLADELRREAAVGGFAGPPGEPGLDGRDGEKGDPGPAGPPGFSPVVRVETSEDGEAVLSVTDAAGTTTTTVLQGPRGEKGERGEPGEVGPQGPQGERGEKGQRGEAGRNGTDAVILHQNDRALDFTNGAATFVAATDLGLKANDWMIDRNRVISRVISAVKDGSTYSYTMEPEGPLRGLSFCVCKGLNAVVGAVKKKQLVNGFFVRPGDYCFSLDTGCIGKVSEIELETDFFTYTATVEVVGRLGAGDMSGYATKAYVDEKFAALPDLTEMEF